MVSWQKNDYYQKVSEDVQSLSDLGDLSYRRSKCPRPLERYSLPVQFKFTKVVFWPLIYLSFCEWCSQEFHNAICLFVIIQTYSANGISNFSTYPEIVFFIGLKVEVKTNTSPFACSNACSSLRPTTERGGMLQITKYH